MEQTDEGTISHLVKVSMTLHRASRRGQTLVEYALILAIISIVAVGVMINLGQKVGSVYSAITSDVASAQASH
jgi:Flp pilus assembly pilin Flp